MKITVVYEIGDKVIFRAPTGPSLNFKEFVGVIDDITLHFDEESDTSNTVYVINVNENLYNIAYPQIIGIEPANDHIHLFELICKICGTWDK